MHGCCMKKTRENDPIRLEHMLDASRKVQKFLDGKSKADLQHDEMLSFAVVRAFGIIGEAANNVTSELAERNPQVPWIDIIGMRNRLVHGYFDVDVDVVWKTYIEFVPKLIEQLEAILAEEEQE